jgi:hypothetical protein
VQGVTLGTDMVYRLYTHQFEDRETNRVWDNSGLLLNPTGEFRTGRSGTVIDLGTPDETRRRYIGFTTSLRKTEGAVKVQATYTWAQLEGNVNFNQNNDYGTNPARDAYYQYGILLDDYRHNLKVSMVYQARPWLSIGLTHRWSSGYPIRRFFRNDVEAAYTDLRAPIGIDPGNRINDPGDDREVRLPDLQQLNLQFRGNLRPLFGVNMEGFVDVLNVLALRTTTSVLENDGPTWGQRNERLGPLSMRLGFRYRY